MSDEKLRYEMTDDEIDEAQLESDDEWSEILEDRWLFDEA